MLSKPSISPDFTVDDIHKIREYHAEITQKMADEERMSFYNDGAMEFLKEMVAEKAAYGEENGK